MSNLGKPKRADTPLATEVSQLERGLRQNYQPTGEAVYLLHLFELLNFIRDLIEIWFLKITAGASWEGCRQTGAV